MSIPNTQEFNYKELEEVAKKAVSYFNSKNIEASLKTSRYRKEIKVVEIFSKLDYPSILKELDLKADVTTIFFENILVNTKGCFLENVMPLQARISTLYLPTVSL